MKTHSKIKEARKTAPSSGHPKVTAAAPMGEDRLQIGAHGPQLGADVFDVHVDRAIETGLWLLPNQVHQLLSREHVTFALDEPPEDFILVLRKLQRRTKKSDRAFRSIDRERLVPALSATVDDIGAAPLSRAPPFTRAERFGNIVVGADFNPRTRSISKSRRSRMIGVGRLRRISS
jgi:hypothetical protein